MFVLQLQLHPRPFVFLLKAFILPVLYIWKSVLVLSVIFHVLLRNYWGQVLGWLLRPWFVPEELEKFRRCICLLPLSSVLWTAAVCYPLQAPAPGPCIPCLSPVLEPAHYCRAQRCPVVELRSYKHLVTTMMKWDTGVLCPVLVPAVGFSCYRWQIPVDPKVSRGVFLCILPFLAIQGVSLMSPSSEAGRAPAAGNRGDLCGHGSLRQHQVSWSGKNTYLACSVAWPISSLDAGKETTELLILSLLPMCLHCVISHVPIVSKWCLNIG